MEKKVVTKKPVAEEKKEKKKEDFECPICLEIIAEPMRTPCNHLFCLSCQKQSIMVN
jgi:hypothetical protein